MHAPMTNEGLVFMFLSVLCLADKPAGGGGARAVAAALPPPSFLDAKRWILSSIGRKIAPVRCGSG